jgi:hypothetical protein
MKRNAPAAEYAISSAPTMPFHSLRKKRYPESMKPCAKAVALVSLPVLVQRLHISTLLPKKLWQKLRGY